MESHAENSLYGLDSPLRGLEERLLACALAKHLVFILIQIKTVLNGTSYFSVAKRCRSLQCPVSLIQCFRTESLLGV